MLEIMALNSSNESGIRDKGTLFQVLIALGYCYLMVVNAPVSYLYVPDIPRIEFQKNKASFH